MKKYFAILLAVAIFGCTNKEQEEKLKQLEADNLKLQEQIGGDANTINDFVNAYNDIQSNLDSIKTKEGIITANTSSGVEVTGDRKEAIKQDIQLIYELSLKNRKKIDDLNKKLKDEKGYTGNLKRMIENLEKQLAGSDAQIVVLKDELAKRDSEVESKIPKLDMGVLYGKPSVVSKEKTFLEVLKRLTGPDDNDVDEKTLISELVKTGKLADEQEARTVLIRLNREGQIFERRPGKWAKP